MLNVRLAGDHLYWKLLFTWLPVVFDLKHHERLNDFDEVYLRLVWIYFHTLITQTYCSKYLKEYLMIFIHGSVMHSHFENHLLSLDIDTDHLTHQFVIEGRSY